MDFAAIVLFLATYYIRPQEWSPVLSALHPVTLVMAFAIVALFLREHGLRAKTLFQTPHDWIMLAYFLYVAFFVPSDSESFATVRNLFIIYFVIVQALTNLPRLRTYLYWWAGCIFFIAVLALASEFGIDPLGSSYFTNYVAKGRLLLNLSIFNNPNALGHSVVPLLAMLYFFLIWRRPIFIKELGVLSMLLPLWCLYLTQSKGAFLAGFAAIFVGLIVGRPKLFQVAIVALSLTVGLAGLNRLPRMDELRNPRKEEGIQGRLLVWEYGLKNMKAERTGIGVFQFAFAFQRDHGYFKPAHSSYVEVATEQGFTGLLFFIGVLYACARTLLTLKITDPEEERIRRVLLVLLCSYAASSWMIGWGYRATFFVMTACVAAFHRHLYEKIRQEAEFSEISTGEQPLVPAAAVAAPRPADNIPLPVPTLAQAIAPSFRDLIVAPAPKSAALPVDKDKPKPRFWYRFGLIDIALVYVATLATVKLWEYVLTKF